MLCKFPFSIIFRITNFSWKFKQYFFYLAAFKTICSFHSLLFPVLHSKTHLTEYKRDFLSCIKEVKWQYPDIFDEKWIKPSATNKVFFVHNNSRIERALQSSRLGQYRRDCFWQAGICWPKIKGSVYLIYFWNMCSGDAQRHNIGWEKYWKWLLSILIQN